MSVRETVLKALEDGFGDGIKGLYGAAISNAAGGESLETVMKRFDAGFVLEAVKLHSRIIADAEAAMDQAGII